MKNQLTTVPKQRSALCYVILILLLGLLSGCSVVGVGGGMLIDSANKKKADKISYDDQKLRLRYVSGQKVKGEYRGLIYYPAHVVAETHSSGINLSDLQQVSFPAIGETVLLARRDNTPDQTGKFAGISKIKNQLIFMLDTGKNKESQNIPFTELKSITLENGVTLSDFPEPDQMILVYELDDDVHTVPLYALQHINYRSTGNMITLGAIGLVTDITIIAVASQMCCLVSL